MGDIGTGAEAGIDETPLPEPVQCVCIAFRPLRLDDRLAVMGDA